MLSRSTSPSASCHKMRLYAGVYRATRPGKPAYTALHTGGAPEGYQLAEMGKIQLPVRSGSSVSPVYCLLCRGGLKLKASASSAGSLAAAQTLAARWPSASSGSRRGFNKPAAKYGRSRSMTFQKPDSLLFHVGQSNELNRSANCRTGCDAVRVHESLRVFGDARMIHFRYPHRSSGLWAIGTHEGRGRPNGCIGEKAL